MMGSQINPPVDRTRLRLAVMFVLVVAAFTALFSRLWFLQVLAAEEFEQQAKENRVRIVESEPPRGRILDRTGRVLVDNRRSLAVSIDRQVLQDPVQREEVLRRLSEVLGIKVRAMQENLDTATVSPFKPVAVAFDVPEERAYVIEERPERFPGVSIERLWVRRYPQGNTSPHILGYVNEISPEFLESDHFRRADPPYEAGDIVGQSGVEYFYDRFLRGRPAVQRVIVNSLGDVVGRRAVSEESPGDDLVLGMDLHIQKATERALANGIRRSQAEGFEAPAGAVVVMDPRNGEVVALASFPTYDPRVAVDGFSKKEFRELGAKTPKDPDDDAFLNRAVQAQRNPASSFKIVTAGAALWSDVIGAYDQLPCPPSLVYPPNHPGGQEFRNYTTANFGYMGFPRSLEVSCDTFYYELGWRMETRFGPARSAGGNGTEKFQRYARLAGFGDPTGIDLPNEASGRVPDNEWCREIRRATRGRTCGRGWLPGYTILMAIGQGDLIATPIQMAVTTAAIAADGAVWQPHLGVATKREDASGKQRVVHDIGSRIVNRLPLTDQELGVIQQGMQLVVNTGEGTGRDAFSGFPLDRFPLAAKTGTSELGESELQDSWFVSYGPVYDPRYAIAVYIEKAGAGGESAAPLARDIWDAILEYEP